MRRCDLFWVTCSTPRSKALNNNSPSLTPHCTCFYSGHWSGLLFCCRCELLLTLLLTALSRCTCYFSLRWQQRTNHDCLIRGPWRNRLSDRKQPIKFAARWPRPFSVTWHKQSSIWPCTSRWLTSWQRRLYHTDQH